MMQKILAFRLSALGDVAMTVPVILAVLEQNPQVEITMVVPSMLHDFYPQHPRLRLVDFDKKNKHRGLAGIYHFCQEITQEPFDAFADLHGVLRSFVLGFLLKNAGVKISKIDKGRSQKRMLTRRYHKILKPLKHTTERYADVFRNLGLKVELNHELKNHLFTPQPKLGNAVGIAPFAKHKGKRYPLNEILQLILHLTQRGKKVYIFGSKQEAASLDGIKDPNIEIVAGKLSFKEELKLISQLDCMLSMDSSNMHMASLVGVPVVSVWGATHPYAGFMGYGQSAENAVQDTELNCRPCSVFGDKKCFRGDWACFDAITPEDLSIKIEKLSS
ncbi:lipopolysaccharide heptosyltransferase family protein [Ornithobacterium rhinotracheale]|uniref:glycosyltransferase family 9 protein n=1 Tax=Ornithobacterium rhinotracheale TaxID=28251 RepID=UPI00129C1803|nr:glycosyltransferase family 9 protein [Ornithobacterium rhinotracheale]MRJ08424.1 lipopolysaccharide heptosyltransferase family protein [Ornithobacterium rhinotracheale]UOH77617.1 glycosyltransferase family 9 protein [Ornithobacterium rhinotracheale]